MVFFLIEVVSDILKNSKAVVKTNVSTYSCFIFRSETSVAIGWCGQQNAFYLSVNDLTSTEVLLTRLQVTATSLFFNKCLRTTLHGVAYPCLLNLPQSVKIIIIKIFNFGNWVKLLRYSGTGAKQSLRSTVKSLSA